MTLAVSWIRHLTDSEELIVSSDSRLTGGRTLDSCAKILLLPGSNGYLCCAGDTDITYPLALQIQTAVSSYPLSADGALDLCDLRGHVLRIINKAVSGIKSPIKGMRAPDRHTEFLFGGYSWLQKRFLFWRFRFSLAENRFCHAPPPPWSYGRAAVLFAGDWRENARSRLIQMLRKKGITPGVKAKFFLDWEPFEVLRDILRENTNNDDASIGGPPQIAKVYQHRNSRYIGVIWPGSDGGTVSIAGRPLLGYEHPDCWILDPDNLTTTHPYYSIETGNKSASSKPLRQRKAAEPKRLL
jgi:hypothetical protein